MKTDRKKDLLCVLLLAAAMSVFFHKEIFLGKTPIGGDLIYMNYPRMAFMRERLLHGEVPLWAPYIYSGYPLAAEGQTGVFYPPNLALPALPPHSMPSFVIIGHLFLAALFMFIMCRAMKLSRAGALAAGMVYGANGFMLIHMQHTSVICAMAWPPLLIALTEIWMSRQGRNTPAMGALAGAVAAVMFLAGHPQFAMYGLFACAVFAAFRMKMHGVRLRSAAVFAAVACVCAALLAAVQILPELELSALSIRPGRISFDMFSTGSLPPKFLLTMILPHFLGAPWDGTFRGGGRPDEFYAFIGALPLLLAASAFFHGKKLRPLILPAGLLAILSIPCALGNFLPAGNILYHIPVINSFRVPARALFFFVLGGSVLCGAGLDYLCRINNAGRAHWKPGKLMSAVIGLGACGLGTVAEALVLLHGRAAGFLLNRLGTAGAAHPHQYYIDKTDYLLKMLERDIFMAAAAAGLLWLILFTARRQPSGKLKWAAVAALVFIAADYTGLATDFSNRTDRSVLDYVPATVRQLKSVEGFSRVYSAPSAPYLEAAPPGERLGASPDYWRRCMDTLDFELPLMYGVYSINGYGSLSLWDYQMLVRRKKFVYLFENRSKYPPFAEAEKNAGELDPAKDRLILTVLKVRHILHPAPGGKLAITDRLAGVSGTSTQFWAICGKNVFDEPAGSKYVFDPARPLPCKECGPSAANVKHVEAGKILASVDMPCRGSLALMEKFYPGWNVREIPPGSPDIRIPRRYFNGFGGIAVAELSPGHHDLEYVFSPPETLTGLAAGLAGVFAILIFFTVAIIVRRR